MFHGKTALVTGATSGIGFELSHLLAENGFNLVLVARDAQRLRQVSEEFRKKFGVGATIIATDLSFAAAAEKIYAEVNEIGINIDILVNNAGFQEYGPFTSTNLQKELEMIQVHVSTLTHITKLFLPGMIRRDYGKILNVGSIGSFTPGGPLNAVYCATKAYLLSFSEAISEELKGTNVTVTALCPGATSTEFAHRAKIEDVRIFKVNCGVMNAREVARVGYDAMMKGKRSIVPGVANKLTVLSTKWVPRRVMTTTAKFLMGRV